MCIHKYIYIYIYIYIRNKQTHTYICIYPFIYDMYGQVHFASECEGRTSHADLLLFFTFCQISGGCEGTC